ncbi:hypothetical protein B9X71_07805 [Acinetobacter baumannii]|uniref:AAA domain-containing protein n=1 Tax=Acinetobacter baumannii TaxID=470 RepID=UPI000A34F63F|nr:AAA domain-containing protein [Acinetobacter baumannii]MCT9166197.1 hypothetical protein [Acinetobacter baumannii]MCT9173608.1 hypothetical protein [Acinetobacter baumannii]MCT9179969.1 hypothetical protein [Acinetobacter baumannii]OTK48160.1 hypothetical protein B9X71_07805 [Acinetobacter baumannii]
MNLDQAKLFKAWQRYIEITGCEKSKIPVRTVNNCQNVKFKDSDFIENPESNGVFIELLKDQIAHLNEKFVSYNEDTEKNELIESLSFAFPLLTIHEKNQSFYLPIFIVDLPSDFLLNEEFCGFDISANLPDSIKVNIAVLMNYLDVDSDQIDESRNLIDLVSLICDQQFQDFKSTYFGFLQWAQDKLEAKGNNSKDIFFAPNTSGLIYTPKSDDFSTNRDLEDFKYILKEIDSQGETIVSNKYPLLNEYVTKTSFSESIIHHLPIDQVKPYGLFESKYSLGRGQFQAIQAANIEPAYPLIAVQGAPGTGKTTLFKSLIAQQITARALAIIDGNDKKMNMLVCSTAIKAVDNVIADLKSDSFTESLNWLWFHGGSKAKVNTEIQNRLITHISSLETEEFNQTKYDLLKFEIKQLQIEIQSVMDSYLTAFRSIELAKSKIPFIKPNQELTPRALQAGLQDYQALKSKNLDQIYKSSIYEDGALERYQIELKAEINKLKEQISDIENALEHVNNLLAFWPNKFTVSQFSDWILNKKVRGIFSISFGDFFKLQFLKIITMFYPAKVNLMAACGVLSQHDQLLDWKNILTHKQVQLNIIEHLHESSINLKAFIDLHQNYLSEYSSCRDLLDVQRTKAIKPNRKIFELSIQFLYQEQLRQKDDLLEVLNHWAAMLKGDNSPKFKKFIKEQKKFYHLLSLAYPVVATTLTSAYRMSGYKDLKYLNETKPWNLVLLDEAGMVSVENLVPIIARSNKAMIVGDPLQLEPIRTISKPSNQKIYNDYFNNNDEEYAMLGPGQVTAYHRAAGTLTGEVSDIGDGIILDEHRRCQAPIAQLFIDIAKYKGISVSTFPPSEHIQKPFNAIGNHHLMFYHVDGERQSGKTNLDEVKAIGELLNRLEEAGYNLKTDIGIITPYADQKRLLINAYGKRMEQEKSSKIGTIHQFQGVGFEVIIFSPVIFEEKDSSAFMNNHPNMLNVAVSRAKQQFIVVGNYHKLKEAKGSLGLIAERASSDFYLELGNQSPSYDNYSTSFNVKKYIYDEQHIKAFEYYLQNCEKSIVIVVPWIRKPHGTSIQKQLELIKAAKNRNINVTVYYGYSNLELNQKDDNDQYLVHEYVKALGADHVIRISEGTHEKVMLIDDRILVLGSWNWLSNAYYKWYENQNKGKTNLAIRRETSIIIMDRKVITEYKTHNLLQVYKTESIN